jgi:hypothetical protein
MTNPRCPCGHQWNEHHATKMPAALLATCAVAGCRCATPDADRLHVRDLMFADWLECAADYADAKRMPGLGQTHVAKVSRWSVFAVEPDRVLLDAEQAGVTIAVGDPELHLHFRLGAT